MVKRLRLVTICSAIAISLCLTSATAWAGPYSAAVLADNPVGYWTFDSVSLDHPFVVNSGTQGASLDGFTDVDPANVGIPGPAYSGFDFGNSAILFTDANTQIVTVPTTGISPGILDFTTGQSFTAELWFQSNGDGGPEYMLCKNRATSGAADSNYGIRLAGEKISFHFHTASGGYVEWESNKQVTFGSENFWHYLAISHTFGDGTTGGATRVYIDGMDITADGAWKNGSQHAIPAVNTADALRIGGARNNTNSTFDGRIDEVAMYNRFLDTSELDAHYAASGRTGDTFLDLPDPGDYVYNGEFEIEVTGPPFPYGWNTDYGSFEATKHAGFSATGAIEPGTNAVLMTVEDSGRFGQDIDPGSRWEVGFRFAVEEISEEGRTLHFIVADRDDRNSGCRFRVNENGDLQVTDGVEGTLTWTTLPNGEGVIAGSIDATLDGDFDDVEDTLNVYSIKVVGDYSDETPTYDVWLSDANSETLNLLAEDVDWFEKSLPPAGTSPYRLNFLGDSSQVGDYLVDGVYLNSWDVTIPGDATGDNIVDADDAKILAQNWGMASGAGWEDGDFNGDGAVNAADAAILAAHWGTGATEESAATVPEPSLIGMLILGLSAMAVAPRRRLSR
ncbi:MAG: hypothetical protein GX621_17320 [Pirellulaceae bacterium]|nr:hypothetical protein [Pirellulaceae bacterium]